MLKVGTHVKIISKSVGVSIDRISYKKGYIVKVYHNGIKIHGYHQNLYYSVCPTMKNRGDHYLECDLVDFDNYLPEDLFEI